MIGTLYVKVLKVFWKSCDVLFCMDSIIKGLVYSKSTLDNRHIRTVIETIDL